MKFNEELYHIESTSESLGEIHQRTNELLNKKQKLPKIDGLLIKLEKEYARNKLKESSKGTSKSSRDVNKS